SRRSRSTGRRTRMTARVRSPSVSPASRTDTACTPGHQSGHRAMSANASHTSTDGWSRSQCDVKWNGADSPARGVTWVCRAGISGSGPGDARTELIERGLQRRRAVLIEDSPAQLLVETAGRLVVDDDIVHRPAHVGDRGGETREEAAQEPFRILA